MGKDAPLKESKRLSPNQTSYALFEQLYAAPQTFGSVAHIVDDVRIVDLGIDCDGGIAAGITLSEISAGGLADVSVSKNGAKANNKRAFNFAPINP